MNISVLVLLGLMANYCYPIRVPVSRGFDVLVAATFSIPLH